MDDHDRQVDDRVALDGDEQPTLTEGVVAQRESVGLVDGLAEIGGLAVEVGEGRDRNSRGVDFEVHDAVVAHDHQRGALGWYERTVVDRGVGICGARYRLVAG